MKPSILITAATGKVGTELVSALRAKGVQTRAAVHSPTKAGAITGPLTEVIDFDFEDAASIRRALDGIETLVLITPPDARQVDWAIRTIDLAKDAGVKRVVRMSVLAAAMEPGITLGRWHRTVERYLTASGLDWTIVRPGPFMQNFAGMYPRSGNRFPLPVGDAAVNHIDVADVAEALAAVVTGDGHSRQTYMVTGPGALTMNQAARILARHEPGLEYHDTPPALARQTFLQAGLPPWFVDVLGELFAAFSTGAVGVETPTFRELTGHDPRTLAEHAASNARAANAA